MKNDCLTSVGITGIALIAIHLPLTAQMVPDGTLPENTIVTPEGNTVIIEGGTESGSNLFHSFEEFSVPTEGTAFFNNAGQIRNIFTRITGGSVSTIDGILRANGNANLFLLNPNGITFGPNAQLNIGGSFFASTGESITFADQTRFSATENNPQPLLTNSVPIGLGLGSNPGNIVNESVSTNAEGEIVGLQVNPGETIGLFGGNILLPGGHLNAPGGELQLVSGGNRNWEIGMGENGALEATDDPNARGSIQLWGQAEANTSGVGGGDIAIETGILSVRDGSQVAAITEGEIGGGNIRVNATEKVEVIGTSPDGLSVSSISSQTVGQGDAGDLSVTTRELQVDNGIIAATSFGTGNSGNLSIRATELVELRGGVFRADPLGLANAAGAAGDAGELTIETRRLVVRDGAVVISGTRSSGAGGNLIIRATESVEVSGTSPNNAIASSIVSAATDGPDALRERYGSSIVSGSAGNVTLETQQLILRDGAVISTSSDGSGDAGNLTIRAAERVEISGSGGRGEFPSSLVSDTTQTGAGGDLSITTGQFLLLPGAVVSARSFGSGDGGNLTLNASDSVELIGSGFEIFQQTFIAGALAGELKLGQLSNGLFTGTAGEGASGSLRIDTGRLILREGAALSTSTFGAGLGGKLTVNATERVESEASGLFSGSLGSGAAGNIEMNAPRLILRDGAQLSSVTLGVGQGGNINLKIPDTLEVRVTPAGSLVATGIFSNTIGGTGKAGDITIDTGRLTLTAGGQILTNSGAIARSGAIPLGGPGGNLIVNARESVELSGVAEDGRVASALGTSTFSGAPAGSLRISTRSLVVRDGAGAFASTEGAGAGGTLTVNASDAIELSGTSSLGRFRRSGLFATSGSDLLPLAASGMAGDLEINTDRLRVREGAEISVNSVESGDAGTLSVNADAIALQARGAINAGTVGGTGGNITLEAQTLELRSGSSITTDAGNADGGNIGIDVETLVALENSDITANALVGRGGRVAIAAEGIFGTQFRDFPTSESDITASSELGAQFSGTVEINTPDVDLLEGLAQLATEFVSPETVVATSCLARGSRDRGSFTVIGTGGIPATPDNALSDSYAVTQVRGLREMAGVSQATPSQVTSVFARERGIGQTSRDRRSWKVGLAIQEANGIQVTEDGRTLLGILPQHHTEAPSLHLCEPE